MPTVDVDESLGLSHTVDGSEIWRSPVEVGNLTHYLQGGHPLAASVCLWLLVFCCHVSGTFLQRAEKRAMKFQRATLN